MIYGVNQQTFFNYDGFVDKFKPKKTTDDCYTPEPLYELVKEHFLEKFNISKDTEIVRPFYPNRNYELYDYPDNCLVLDNPPFSINANIRKFYVKHNIKFILFANHLTLFTNFRNNSKVSCIYVGTNIEYDNKAKINTSFITNIPERQSLIFDKTLQNKIFCYFNKNKKVKVNRELPEDVYNSATLLKFFNNFEHGIGNEKIEKFEIYNGGYIGSIKRKEVFGTAIKILDKKFNKKIKNIT